MGTNYFHHAPRKNYCECCGRYDEGKITHIGKSSGGWVFLLHVTDTIKSLEDWEKVWETGEIYDEYENRITPHDMYEIITNRSWAYEPKTFDRYSQIGPNNLFRNRVRDGVTHGPGTWDLVDCDFS